MPSEVWKFKRTIGMGLALLVLMVLFIVLYKSFIAEEDKQKQSAPTLLEIDGNETIIEGCKCNDIYFWLQDQKKEEMRMELAKKDEQIELKFKLYSLKKNRTPILVLSDKARSTELFKVQIGISKNESEVKLVQNGSVLADGNSAIGKCHSGDTWRQFILKINIAEGTLSLLDQDILLLEAKIGKFMASKIKFYNFLYTRSDEVKSFDILQTATECTQYTDVGKEKLTELVSLHDIQNCVPYNKINKKFFCRA